MSSVTLIKQLTDLLLSRLRNVAADDEDLRRQQSEVMKLSGTLSKFKRSKQIRKLIESVRPFMESLPNFYGDFYTIIAPKICYSSYAPKFFDLVDVILSSNHIPAYIVAAYVKKLSRVLLTAPLTCQLPIITLIKNILYRHNAVHQILVNRKEPESLADDPYDENEQDLIKCRAKDSSLWELRSIQQHWFHKVAEKANFIDRPAPGEDVPLAWQTADEIFSAIAKKATLKLKRSRSNATNNNNEEEKMEADEQHVDDLLFGSSDEEKDENEHRRSYGRHSANGVSAATKEGKAAEKPLINLQLFATASNDNRAKAEAIFGVGGLNGVWSL